MLIRSQCHIDDDRKCGAFSYRISLTKGWTSLFLDFVSLIDSYLILLHEKSGNLSSVRTVGLIHTKSNGQDLYAIVSIRLLIFQCTICPVYYQLVLVCYPVLDHINTIAGHPQSISFKSGSYSSLLNLSFENTRIMTREVINAAFILLSSFEWNIYCSTIYLACLNLDRFVIPN